LVKQSKLLVDTGAAVFQNIWCRKKYSLNTAQNSAEVVALGLIKSAFPAATYRQSVS